MSKRILIIEPSRTIRLLLDITLRNAGHTVAAFDKAPEALNFLLRVHKNAPDIAFVAVHLPDGESYKIIETLMRHYPHLLMASILRPDDGSAEQQRILSLGAALLMRPFTVQDILTCTTSTAVSVEKRSAIYEHA